ncbi:MAG: RNase adapter RapZ [Gammaproteobacteria bacterium]
MKIIIVSGLSGSGKSVALHTLEDIGYYCVDNLPISMLERFINEISQATTPVEGIAVGIDVRNLSVQIEYFGQVLHSLNSQDIKYQILFLRCNNQTLLKRFSETRRRHPLSNSHTSLQEAINTEQKLLEPVAGEADLLIDTSNSNVHELRDLVRQRIEYSQDKTMSLLFESFGYKRGIPSDADFVFDARCLPNPYWDESLRDFTGRDSAVIKFLEKQPQVIAMHKQLMNFLEEWIPEFSQASHSYLTVAIGCTGGKHRSVYLTEQLGRYFRKDYPNLVIRHRDIS